MSRVAILPALDEEDGIAAAIAGVPPGVVSEIIVVDNGSADRTAERARAAGARVVHEPRRGYGSACLAGVRAAPRALVYVFLDGDASEVAGGLADMVAVVEHGEAQLVLGVREGDVDPGAMPWQQRLGNRLLTTLLNRLSGGSLRDLPSLKVVDGPTLRSLGLREQTYGWTAELISRAAFRGVRITQVPTGLHRRRGRSKVSGSIANSLRAGRDIAATILRVWRDERRRRDCEHT
ncbi:MAG: glycosyltransferase [Chloroflexi bacterium]|nr:glycosyltransferase [Chloroflexota bacterium]